MRFKKVIQKITCSLPGISYGFISLQTATALLNELDVAYQNGGSAIVTSSEHYQLHCLHKHDLHERVISRKSYLQHHHHQSTSKF